jgi:hypothetical protein
MAAIVHPNTPRSRGDSEAPHMSSITSAEDAWTILMNEVFGGAPRHTPVASV